MNNLRNYYFNNEKYNKFKFYNLLYNLQIKSYIVIEIMNKLYIDDYKINNY